MAIHDLRNQDETLNRLFRELPSVNDLLLTPACQALLNEHPRSTLLFADREALANLRRLVTLLQRNKTLVRMGSDDLFIHAEALKQLAVQLAALRGSLIDVARFKQFTGLSRKYAIPLLEYLDRQRITRKEGDKRLIL